MRNVSLFENERLTLADALDLTAISLQAYGATYRHWAVAYSGGKDSSATVTAVVHLIETGRVPKPETLSVLYADTRMELPPLQTAAMETLAALEQRGVRTQVVLPAMDDRFFVYVLGRGVPPPKNNFRWCTPQLKIEPMLGALQTLRHEVGEKILMITGVRVGESAARDQRIALSCGRDGAECGQGWFQQTTSEAVADTLAPILHWRVCHVWDWLTFDAPPLGFPTTTIAEVYGGDEARELNARTGCIQCPLASRDTALEYLLGQASWAYLSPLKRLRPLYKELRQPKYRLRKDGSERRKDGTVPKNLMRLGPLTFDARRYALNIVLGIQTEINDAARAIGRPEVWLINAEEQERILALIAIGTWPQGWSGDEVRGDVALPQMHADGSVQDWLLTLNGAD
ncbi:MAG: phosphoadenosine phosphosulfate reductase family protein [Chloroflexi bacterium]|nr:phosphoadenosine phosphosulfate reductase family protein [Chloroflexota bacterium]